ncbi:FhaA domain-containing protein [Rhodococcus sp. NPDC049939]|uniref:FhaA domain-containing protein n=1 Tax=Rhodococcus sp. NPDC049939 TaxID=3155511 RepID=UPI0033D8BB82
MGIVQRFERKLQGAIGDAFARVFGGSVVPHEVEASLQQEASDQVQQLEGGHLLAPNIYVITINNSDYGELAGDADLTVKAFSRHLEDFIREQGWQTYGTVRVAFEPSSSLHTGQFRTRSWVDPDAGRPSGTKSAQPEPQGGRVQRPPTPSVPVTSNPGAGPMTQNSGYDPSREPAGNRKPDPQDARNGHAHPGQDQRSPQGYQNGYDRGAHPQEQAYGQAYDQGPPGRGYEQPAYGQQPGYDQQGYDQHADSGYRDAGYQQDYQGGYDQQAAPARYPDGSYADGGYQQPQSYDQGGYQQGYDQQGYADYDQQSYQQGYDQQGYDQQGYADYDQQSYQQGYDQQGYADYDQQGYQQPYPPAGSQTFTATLQLEDGSGRHFQLREGNNIIGRGQEAQFRLPDTGVSRRHIDIRWDGRVAMLSDLGSTNGTTVNGAPVQDWQLADGDIIRAGHSEILVRIL